MGNLTGQSAVQALGIAGVRATSGAPPIQPNKTVNPLEAVGGTPYNYQTIAAARASQAPGDWIQIQPPASSAMSPYVFDEQFVNKGVASGTAGNRIRWTMAPGAYARIHLSAGLGLIPTAYGAAGPGGAWLATTNQPVGQGLFHCEGVSYVDWDFRDASGNWALEIGDPSEWTPGNYGQTGVPVNPFTYNHYQSFTLVTASYCTFQGLLVHGSNQYTAGYGGWDCHDNYFDIWFDRHGTNYGFKNNAGTIEAAGDMFVYYGYNSRFYGGKSTYCGHDTGPGIRGHNNIVDNWDYSGDWSAFNTGKPYGYGANFNSGFLDSYIPTLPQSGGQYASPPPLGPNVLQNSRVLGCGPGELSGSPYMAFPCWATLVRQCVFVRGAPSDQFGHNIQEANESMLVSYTAAPTVGRTKFCHNSVYGTPGIYDATDAGIQVAANALCMAQDAWANNVFDKVTDSGSPGPYLVRHLQTGANCGNDTNYPNNLKGCQFFGNLLNGPAASGNADGSGRVYSRTLSFGRYQSNAAQVSFVDVLDAATFPNDIFDNRYLTNIAWVNVNDAQTGTLALALLGLKLAGSNPDGIGTAQPLTLITSAGTAVTTIHVSDPAWFCDGYGITIGGTVTPDTVAIVPFGSGFGSAALRQIASGGLNFANSTITLTSSITVGVNDGVFLVLPDGVTIAENNGRN